MATGIAHDSRVAVNPAPLSHATSAGPAQDTLLNPTSLDVITESTNTITSYPQPLPTSHSLLDSSIEASLIADSPYNSLPTPGDENDDSPMSSATISIQARRGRDGFWKLNSDRPSTPTVVARGNGLVPSAPTTPLLDDEEMLEVPIIPPTDVSTPVPGGSGISLVLRLPGGAGVAGTESRQSSPGSIAQPGSKRKRKIDSTGVPPRSFRSRYTSPPSLSTSNGHQPDTSIEGSPAPSQLHATEPKVLGTALSIFAVPDTPDPIPDALKNAISSTTATSRLRARDKDGDAMMRDVAVGLASSRTLRPSRGRETGVRTGVSASGKGVKVGGTPRTSVPSGTGGQKKKGKGKNAEGDVPNQDFCSSCRGIGRFLCCDGCPRSFHFMCLEPPLRVDELPEEERWFCKKCKTERASAPPATPVKELKPIAMVFSQLSQKLDQENPAQFRLPQDIRQFFTGVSTGPKGDYVDSEETRTKYDRKGFQEERDGTRLKDGKSRPVACYVCGGTSIPLHSLTTEPEAAWRQIVSCDYCSLHWHLDCLDPPMASMPNSGRRWMCPNHAEQVMPRRRTVRNNLETVDIEERGQRNNGNIVILPDEEPRPTIEYEDMVINSRKYRVPEKIIRLDFWEKLGLGKGRIIPPAKNGDFPFGRRKRLSGTDSDLTSLASDVVPTQADLDAANLVLGLLHPHLPVVPDAEAHVPTAIPNVATTTPMISADDHPPRKIMLRVSRPVNGDSVPGDTIVVNGSHY